MEGGGSAFADAVARARQIAAKINQPTPGGPAGGGGGGDGQGTKRPFEDPAGFGEPEAKKSGNTFREPVGAQLKALADQQRASQAALAAQEAAARINQQLGVPPSQQQPPKPPNPGAQGAVMTENFTIPDKLVGLVIGKNGEQIARLQAETTCKVQIDGDSGGMPDRHCTLTGSPGAIAAAKQTLKKIIERGQAGMPMDHMGGGGGGGMGGGGGGGGGMGDRDGNQVLELLIPGNKVGLVIGKGGETIKNLQENAGVKMVMIQDSNQPSSQDKPLRISGDPMKCQRAKEMVLEMLAAKDDSMNNFNEFGSPMGGRGGMEIPVPRQAVGLVIGKGGEMIKKIQSETGAKVQFKPDDGQTPERVCTISGPPDKIQAAANMIHDMLGSAGYELQGGPGGMGRGFPMGRGGGGRGRGRGGPGGPGGPPGGPFGGPPGGGRGRGFDPNFQDETTYAVPADKCGLVIGKGGEAIREINRISGAHVELQRNPPPNPNEKLFLIRGTPPQIEHAIQLICEKAGLVGGGGGGGGGGGMPGDREQQPGGPGPGGPPGGPQGGPGPQGPQGPGPQQGGPGYDQYGQWGQPNPQAPMQQNPYGGNQPGWGGNYSQYPGGQPQGDPAAETKQPPQQQQPQQPQDANAAAWAAYYSQYYAQYGQYATQAGAPQQPQQPQPQPAAQQPQPQQTVNPQTGQPDYSQAWAEYYRAQGNHAYANMILQQAQQAAAGGSTSQPQPMQQ